MRQALWLMPLLFVGCSCQRAPADATPAPAAAPAPQRTPPPAPPAAAVEAAATGLDLLGAVNASAPAPSQVLQRYVVDLLNRDQPAIDAAWAFAPADPRRADDAALRLLPDVLSLRLQSELPEAIGTQVPPRLLQVPVTVRARTAQGAVQYTGWYRMQPNADGSAWVIQSAALQPTLD